VVVGPAGALVAGVALIADALWFSGSENGVRSSPAGAPSPTPVISTPIASPTADATPISPTLAMPTPSVDPTASPTASPRSGRWSFCRHVSDVADLRHAVLRGTKPPRALVEQAEALEAHLTDPALDDLKDIVGRLRRAILDAGGEYPSDFEVQGWAEALELVSTTAQVQLDCKGER
jgi:hypothetical protein